MGSAWERARLIDALIGLLYATIFGGITWRHRDGRLSHCDR